MYLAWTTLALEGVGESQFHAVRTWGLPGTQTGKRTPPHVKVSLKSSQEAKVLRYANGDRPDGREVGALLVSALLNLNYADNGAARRSLDVGGRETPPLAPSLGETCEACKWDPVGRLRKLRITLGSPAAHACTKKTKPMVMTRTELSLSLRLVVR